MNVKGRKIKKFRNLLILAMLISITFNAVSLKAESMADMATSISNFEVLKDVKIDKRGTNFYSVDIAEKGTLTLTTTRKDNDDISINVYNENGECVFTNIKEYRSVSKDIQYISLEKGAYIISIYSNDGSTYDLTTSFNKATTPEIIMAATIKIGKSLQLGAALTKGTEKITWKSNKSSVAKVSSNGLVTGKKVGSAIITATSQSGLVTKIKIIVAK